MKILDGKAASKQVRAELKTQVEEFVAETGITPHLAAILVGDDPASAVYVRNKERACAKAGMKSTLHRLPVETTEEELLALVNQLNSDESVHGILCQLPLPKQINEQRVLDAVTPEKDVDCFHPMNVGLMSQGRPRFLPCTPHGIQELLRINDINTSGMHAVVIGRSEIVGKPMASMLVQRGNVANCTVTVCHSGTKNLAAMIKQADLLIVAIGKPEFVTGDMIKPGAIVVDVGINRVDDKLVGDVAYESAAEVASAITPVPGGVGPMTIAMLLKNTRAAAKFASVEGPTD
ncbi:MAG: bifunctional methylenetetrahydrofolate dehydrogenase/methenyltetrahydrofolate cyclohydrolase FolD [Planctomycetaceae bacterium]